MGQKMIMDLYDILFSEMVINTRNTCTIIKRLIKIYSFG